MKADAFIVKNGIAASLKDRYLLFTIHGYVVETGPGGKLYIKSKTKLPFRTQETECLIRVDHLPIDKVLNILGY